MPVMTVSVRTVPMRTVPVRTMPIRTVPVRTMPIVRSPVIVTMGVAKASAIINTIGVITVVIRGRRYEEGWWWRKKSKHEIRAVTVSCGGGWDHESKGK